jgi:hypothetical protein
MELILVVDVFGFLSNTYKVGIYNHYIIYSILECVFWK